MDHADESYKTLGGKRALFWAMWLIVIGMMAGCSGDAAPAVEVSVNSGPPPKNIAISSEYLSGQCNIRPSVPKLYIFDGDGKLISTEKGFSPGQPLNIESGKLGPLADEIDQLERCVASRDVDMGSWRACGTDYCVVRFVLDETVGDCPYCDVTQSSLDAFFKARDTSVTYYDIQLMK